MRALAIDTSTHRCEVALWAGGACVARERSLEPVKHAESLLGLIERVFGSAGWQKTDLDLVVPCLGPGSFTGVRAGVATAKGIALALDRPIVGVGGLEAMAHAFWELAPPIGRDVAAVVTLLDARKGEVYWAAYGRENRTLGGPGHVAAERLALVIATLPQKRIVIGEVASLNPPPPEASVFRSPETDLPDVVALASLGVRAFERRGSDDIGALEPIYVRPPDITLPRSK